MGAVEVTKGLPVAISLDFEREWSYLLLALEALGLGPEFLKWSKLLYTAPRARVKTGQQISRQFEIGRGTHQGCSLSPIIFALAMATLATIL